MDAADLRTAEIFLSRVTLNEDFNEDSGFQGGKSNPIPQQTHTVTPNAASGGWRSVRSASAGRRAMSEICLWGERRKVDVLITHTQVGESISVNAPGRAGNGEGEKKKEEQCEG